MARTCQNQTHHVTAARSLVHCLVHKMQQPQTWLDRRYITCPLSIGYHRGLINILYMIIVYIYIIRLSYYIINQYILYIIYIIIRDLTIGYRGLAGLQRPYPLLAWKVAHLVR